jgi:hypothetical protein
LTRVRYAAMCDKMEQYGTRCTDDESFWQAYGRAKANFGHVKGLYGQLQNVGFITYDMLPKIWNFAGVAMVSYLPKSFRGEVCTIPMRIVREKH